MRSTGLIGFFIDIVVDFLQIAKVRCILQSIAGCCSNRGILTLCIFGTIKGTIDVRDLVAADIDIATSDGSRTITAKDNLSTGSLVAFSLLVADGRNARQIFGQLDFQLAICRAVDADIITFRQVLAVRTADDIESVVQLLGNGLRCIVLCIIAGILHAVFQCSYLMFASLVFIDNTGDTIFAIDAFCTIDTIFVIAILDRDIDGSSRVAICTFHAVGAGRSRETDMADTVFTGNGDRIFAVFAGDANLTVDTILTGFAFRASDGDTVFTRCTIFTVKTADRDAIRAVQANMTIFAIDANLTIFTILTRFTNIDILGQFQIIRDFAILVRGFMEQDVLAGVDILILIILSTSCCIAFYG